MRKSTGYYDKNGETIYGKAVDINENGNLVVKTRDGKTEILNSGEISIKWDR